MMTFLEFVDYVNSFYGPSGLYPTVGKSVDITNDEVFNATIAVIKQYPDHEIAFDSTDRELVRDELISEGVINPFRN